MRIEIRGNLLIITYKDSFSSDTSLINQCCKPNRTVLTRRAILGYTADCAEETIKLILDGAEPIWLYFTDSPVGDVRFDAGVTIIEEFLCG